VAHVLAADDRPSAVGKNKAREDLDERGLAGAVGSEKAEDLPRLDVQIDAT